MAASLKIIFTGKKGSFSTPLIGEIILAGCCEIGPNDERFLTCGCLSIGQLEEEANKIKSQLDSIVRNARDKFP